MHAVLNWQLVFWEARVVLHTVLRKHDMIVLSSWTLRGGRTWDFRNQSQQDPGQFSGNQQFAQTVQMQADGAFVSCKPGSLLQATPLHHQMERVRYNTRHMGGFNSGQFRGQPLGGSSNLGTSRWLGLGTELMSLVLTKPGGMIIVHCPLLLVDTYTDYQELPLPKLPQGTA